MQGSTAALLEEGVVLHRRGSLAEAASRYSAILQADPANVDALYYLAMIACQRGRFDQGAELIRKALTIKPDLARAHNLLGLALGRLGQTAAALQSFDEALRIDPDFAESYGNRANLLSDLGRFSEALVSYDRAVLLRPDSFEDWCNRGLALFQLGRNDEALVSYDRALVLRGDSPEAHLQRGAVLAQVGRHEEALSSYDNVLALDPSHADALSNRGQTLTKLRRYGEALQSFDRAIAAAPRHVAAHCNRGAVFRELGRLDEALASCDAALALDHRSVEALSLRGAVLASLGRPEQALASLDRALIANPRHVGALNNRGIVFGKLGRFDDALASFDRALSIDPSDADILNNRGCALFSLLRTEEALASCERALRAMPDSVDALCNRGHALFALGRYEEALASYQRVSALRPDHVDALYRSGAAFRRLHRFDAAISCYRKALAIDPAHADAFNALLLCLHLVCDWKEIAAQSDEVAARVAAGTSPVEPFLSLIIDSTPAQQLTCARHYARLNGLAGPAAPEAERREHSGRLRIAYISADYRRHPVAYLIAHLFELHDRSRFEVFGISFGPDDKSEMRERIAKSFDQFHDVSGRTDGEASRLLRELRVDIAIDLMGHTDDARLGILAARPAPIQVTYLGYPGTTGVDFIDYVIADHIVLPLDQQSFYSERIVHLPDCYQVNDSTKAIAPRTPSRREAGLPEKGVVLCCFNQNYKITAPVFDVWLRLLAGLDDGVLWLLSGDDVGNANLRSAASARGIDPDRLVFAPRKPLAEHLARFGLADLFLDTLPYNAHTTASDALWVGVPLVTRVGTTFAGRVAASLANAIGLPELVTHDLAQYEALAFALARDPARRMALRRKIEAHRATHPLFDTDRTRRHLEAAYSTMWDIYCRGESPRSFRVEPLDAHG